MTPSEYLGQHVLEPIWRAENGITQEVVDAARERGMPPLPVVPTVLRADGIAWVQLARLLGVLPPARAPAANTEPAVALEP
jgi:hypothetical protein